MQKRNILTAWGETPCECSEGANPEESWDMFRVMKHTSSLKTHRHPNNLSREQEVHF